MKCPICNEVVPKEWPVLDNQGRAMPCNTCLTIIKKTVKDWRVVPEGVTPDPDIWEELNDYDTDELGVPSSDEDFE